MEESDTFSEEVVNLMDCGGGVESGSSPHGTDSGESGIFTTSSSGTTSRYSLLTSQVRLVRQYYPLVHE